MYTTFRMQFIDTMAILLWMDLMVRKAWSAGCTKRCLNFSTYRLCYKHAVGFLSPAAICLKGSKLFYDSFSKMAISQLLVNEFKWNKLQCVADEMDFINIHT